MRILSILLSLFIFSLSVSSVADMIETKADKRCSTPCCATPISQEQSTPGHDENSSNALCNPFTVACSSCIGFMLQAPVAFSNPIEAISTELAFYIPLVSQQLTHSIWDPPKIV